MIINKSYFYIIQVFIVTISITSISYVMYPYIRMYQPDVIVSNLDEEDSVGPPVPSIDQDVEEEPIKIPPKASKKPPKVFSSSPPMAPSSTPETKKFFDKDYVVEFPTSGRSSGSGSGIGPQAKLELPPSDLPRPAVKLEETPTKWDKLSSSDEWDFERYIKILASISSIVFPLLGLTLNILWKYNYLQPASQKALPQPRNVKRRRKPTR